MQGQPFPYTIFPLGDAAITIDFGNTINEAINQEVLKRYHQLKENPLPGMIEAIPAYSSLTIYFDIIKVRKENIVAKSAYEIIKDLLIERMLQPANQSITKKRLIKIPVCYETTYAPDLHRFMVIKNITKEELIELHTSMTYKVYMIGFLPGFAYMGEVHEKIAMPRKQQPKTVPAGSVGIAGKQTGIYPSISPGGWQIIGRTPLKMFDPEKEDPILLQAGDSIQFYSISQNEYADY